MFIYIFICYVHSVEQLCQNTISETTTWNPLLLVVPLRLGLVNINPIYIESLKVSSYIFNSFLLQIMFYIFKYIVVVSSNASVDRNDRRKTQSGPVFHRLCWYVLFVRCREKNQYLFILCTSGDDVVFLDPHLTQNAIDFDDEQFDDSSYHPETCARISFQSMDPSLAVVCLYFLLVPEVLRHQLLLSLCLVFFLHDPF